MAQVKPFKGLMYDPRIVGDLSKVMAPPYDVISESMQEEFYRLHNNNVVRLILGKIKPGDNKSSNRYTRAAKYLNEWLKNGSLIKNKTPCFYVYGQEYFFKGQMKTRWGFISLMKIEDPHTSRVLPHEYTFPKPKKDRLDLLKATGTNLSPIFSLFEDVDSSVLKILKESAAGKPAIEIEQEGVSHKIWRLENPEAISRISGLMEDKQIFIADGHHRYEVALNFRNFIRNRKRGTSSGDYEYIMVYFSSLNPDALTILSTHRVIRSIKGLNFKKTMSRLNEYFHIEEFKSTKGMFNKMDVAETGDPIFGMYFKGKGFLSLKLRDEEILSDIIIQRVSYRWKWLDVTILHQLIFDRILEVKEKVAKRDNIVYTRDVNYAVKLVDEEDYQLAFFLNPPRIEQVRDVACSREKMPHKSTYFYPKPLSGFVFYKMEF